MEIGDRFFNNRKNLVAVGDGVEQMTPNQVPNLSALWISVHAWVDTAYAGTVLVAG